MMVYATLKTLHILAIIVWIGGMVFTHFFLRPSLSLLDPPQRLRLMHAVLGRFFQAVLVAAFVVLATGGWMIGRVARATGSSFHMSLRWTLMTVLGVLMIAIFGHIRFVLYKRLAQAVGKSDWPAGAAAMTQIRQWVVVNLAIGIVIVVATLSA